jgi:hypothetical protein
MAKARKQAVEAVAAGQPRKSHATLPLPQWKQYLDSYHDLRALHFKSEAAFSEAARRLYAAELRDLPYDLLGDRTIIVPSEALAYFDGLDFAETEILSSADLPPREIAQLRKEQGPY